MGGYIWTCFSLICSDVLAENSTRRKFLPKESLLSNFRAASGFPKRLFLEWILQNKFGHIVVFTQCSILNRCSPDVDENRSLFFRQRIERIELHLGRKHPFEGVLALI